MIEEYTRRRDETIHHTLLDRTIPRWSLPHLQATLMARHLRDDLDDYAPYLADR